MYASQASFSPVSEGVFLLSPGWDISISQSYPSIKLILPKFQVNGESMILRRSFNAFIHI